MKTVLQNITEKTIEGIKDFLKKHNLTEIHVRDITETHSVTIVEDPHDVNNSETLDVISYNPKTGELSFSSSSCWDSNYWTVNELQAEPLSDILEWLTENEKRIIDFYKSDNSPEKQSITTVYGKMTIENGYAISCDDKDFFFTLPHGDMTNDEIKDFLRILWEEEHTDEEKATPVKTYITVSLEMRRKDGKPITEEDIDEIISNCDYNFIHEDIEIETEICGRNLL